MQFCGIDGFGKFVKSNGGTGVGLNIFTQLDEPEIKDGIWVKTDSKYEKVIIDNRVLQENGMWLNNMSNIPYAFKYGGAVVYNGEIHLLGSEAYTTYHYKWDGSSWTSVSTLPYKFSYGSAVVYNGEIHILGSNVNGNVLNHYKWNGSSWTSVSTIPNGNGFYEGSAVVYNGEIHILGGRNMSTYHYKWDSSSWTSVSTLPYNFSYGAAVVYNGEIHILGSGNYTARHYKWDGSSWTSVSTLPYNFSYGSAVVYNGEIHILGGRNMSTYHYKWDGSSWTSVSTLPYEFKQGSAVVKDNYIVILGSSTRYSQFTTPNNVYDAKTLILQKSNAHSGVYLTAIADTSVITGEYNRFVSSFDDVYYFDENAFDWDAEMYFGNGTEWVKFKN